MHSPSISRYSNSVVTQVLEMAETKSIGATALHMAALSGNVDEVRMLLREGPETNVDCTDPLNQTPIHYAVLKGHLAVMRVLVSEFMADLSAKDYMGNTPLLFAAKYGHNCILFALVCEYHCPVDDTNKDGQTIFDLCHQHKNTVALSFLCNNGLSSMKMDAYGKSLLHYACEWGDATLINNLILEHHLDIDAKDNQGKTPIDLAVGMRSSNVVLLFIKKFSWKPMDNYGMPVLYQACAWKDNFRLVQFLIHRQHTDERYSQPDVKRKMAEVQLFFDSSGEYKNNQDTLGRTLLHYASTYGDVQLARALINKHKARIDIVDNYNLTPFDLAVSFHNVEVTLAFLNEFDCNPKWTDCDGKTLLHYACKWGDVEFVKTLIQKQFADIYSLDGKKCVPLDAAIVNRNVELILLFIDEFDYDPNRIDCQDKTLLHYACEWGDVELANTLLNKHKVDISVLNSNMNALFDAAVIERNVKLILLFLDKFGYDPNRVDSHDRTLLHYACEWGDAELANTLVKKYQVDISALNTEKNTLYYVAVTNRNVKLISLFLDEFDYDPNKVDIHGKTILHYACEWGDVELASTLVKKHEVDISVLRQKMWSLFDNLFAERNFKSILLFEEEFPELIDEHGRTLLHSACRWGEVEIVEHLLKSTSPLRTDKDGNTPLHFAAEANSLESLKLLVSKVPPMARNAQGLTPSEIAVGESKKFLVDYIKDNSKQIQASYKKVLTEARKKYSGSHFVTRVFVIGNPGAGKSSFIESLKREGFLQSFRKVSESNVPPHTAGIIPSVYMSKRYGRVLFYDFAGDAEYYSSHAAIFESIASSRMGDNIFILVVDLREDDDVIETTLYYWLSFIQYQKFHNLSLIIVGSHLDSKAFTAENKTKVLELFCAVVHHSVHNVQYFMLDCRNPRSNQIAQLKGQIMTWVQDSQMYEISYEATLLLGLLKTDFEAVTACPVKTIKSHIKDCGIWVPTDDKAFHQVLLELHEVGECLVLGDYTKKYYHTILKISMLTNEVHKLLFAKSAFSNLQKSHSRLKAAPFNIGILPENVLSEILPSHITKECLIHFQYCQQISHSDVGVFPSLDLTESTKKAFLFFPAFCSLDKSEVSWEASSGKNFSFGWLALCTNPHDYYPSRFLHVLLLRLVHSFALSVPAEAEHVSYQYSHRCTMWKKGVHWKMEEGVDCTVELVNESKGIVVHCKSFESDSEICTSIFVRIVGYVMEAKAEFCYSVKPHFFLLDSSDEADYLSHDHLFALSDVERALKHPEGKKIIISVSGRGEMALSKLQCLHRLTHWDSLFPITSDAILHFVRETAINLHEFGQRLGAPHHVIKNIEDDFPYDSSRRKYELVRWWVSSFQGLPCWWHLVQALEEIDENVLAKKIKEDYGPYIQLQEKLLGKEIQAQKPDEEFLCSFSRAMGSRWSSLAVSLALSEGEIEDLKGKVGLTQEDLALEMLKIWSLKEEATYGQLCLKLRTITLFQYSS